MPRPRSFLGIRDPWSVVYSLSATDGFNARLHGVLRDLTRDTLAAVGDPLVAVVVAGSYGEGTGQCVAVSGGVGSGLWSHGQAPADDLELLVVVNAPKRTILKLLEPVSRKYSAILKVPVNFVGILDEAGLARVRPTLAWYELVQAHHMLFGSERVFDALKRRLGILADGCADPDFPPDEAQWIHTLSGFRAMTWFGGDGRRSTLPTVLYYQAVRGLGDAVLVQRGSWSVERAKREATILALASGDEWFAGRPEDTRQFLDLYRAAVGWFNGAHRCSDGSKPDHSLSAVQAPDLGAFARAWLLVADSLYAKQTVVGEKRIPLIRRLIHAGVNRWFRHQLIRPASGQGRKNRLFAVLGEWYYRSHQ